MNQFNPAREITQRIKSRERTRRAVRAVEAGWWLVKCLGGTALFYGFVVTFMAL